jgi:hypothetical protein
VSNVVAVSTPLAAAAPEPAAATEHSGGTVEVLLPLDQPTNAAKTASAVVPAAPDGTGPTVAARLEPR